MLCIIGYLCRSLPPVCQYEGRAAESGGEAQPPKTAAGPEMNIFFFFKFYNRSV